MKVMQVIPEFGLAGAEIMCENLILGLIDRGNEVIAVSLYAYESPIVQRLKNKRIKILFLNKRNGFDLNVYKELWAVLKKEKPDVIHTHRYVMEYVVPIARLLGFNNLVHTVHSVAKEEQGRIHRTMSKFFYRRCGVIPVALSKEIQRTINEEYTIPEENIPIIFNGEDLEKFERKQSYDLNEQIRILHIGRFQGVKNQEVIVKAVGTLINKGYNVRLTLVGDYNSEYGKGVKVLIDQLQLSTYIDVYGVTDNVSALFNKADIFILPSLYEGVPMTLIEAMASGMPIIASNVGGIPDMLVDNESALLIYPSEEQLVSSILKLYNNQGLREKIGNNAFVRSKLFSNKVMAERYEKVYSRNC